MRRLPVYLLLDTSGSMRGDPIESVRNGVQVLHSTLRRDPYALELAYISVITFGAKVEQVAPLTEVYLFRPPELVAGGGTLLGAALKKVAECADREVKKTTPDEKGDWKPLVFIMTDGRPSGREPVKMIAEFRKRSWGSVVACGTDNADFQLLHKITETVVKLSLADSNAIAAFFKWVSASIATSSKALDRVRNDDDPLGDLPPPPPEIILV